jgi:hypothetical protein
MVSGHRQTIDSALIKAKASMASLELKVREEDLGAYLYKTHHISAMDIEVLVRKSKSNKASK